MVHVDGGHWGTVVWSDVRWGYKRATKAVVFDDVAKDGETDVYKCLCELNGEIPEDIILVKDSFTPGGGIGVVVKGDSR